MTSFADVTTAEIHRFVSRHPLAWIVPTANPVSAALMPLLFENADCSSVIGHLPKRVAHAAAFQETSSVVCLFLGPHAYIPPEWARKHDWIPTWNFLSLKLEGSIQFSDELTYPAVERLVDHMQADSTSNWSIKQVEHRLPALLDRIIGFRVMVERLVPRFKVGQDEDERVLARLEKHLCDHPILPWMHR